MPALQTPAPGMADYVPDTPKRRALTGICPGCEGLMHRRTSPANLKAAAGNLAVSIQCAELRLGKTHEPCSNHHFDRGA